jgi:hypothetical protein
MRECLLDCLLIDFPFSAFWCRLTRARPRQISPHPLLAYRFLFCVVVREFRFFVPTPFVSEAEPHAPFGADDRDDVRLAAPIVDPPLADADQAEQPCLPERVANRGRACASSSRELRYRSIAIAPVPYLIGDDTQYSDLAGGEVARQLWRQRPRCGQAAAPLNTSLPVRRPLYPPPRGPWCARSGGRYRPAGLTACAHARLPQRLVHRRQIELPMRGRHEGLTGSGRDMRPSPAAENVQHCRQHAG